MKKHFLVIGLSLFGVLKAQSQSVMPQVTAAAGGQGQTAQHSLNWTVGESVITTVSNGSNTLTQGFHQPGLTVVTIPDNNNLNGVILHYPNPVAEELVLDLSKLTFNSAICRIYDANGKLVSDIQVNKAMSKVSFNGFAAGQYTVSVLVDNNKTQNFSIIKNN